MDIKRTVAALCLLILLTAPLRAGRTTNGTTDYLTASMGTHGIFPANISATQAQGSVSFFLNLIAFPAGGGSAPACGVHCGEIVNVIAGHNAAVNGCQTTIGACLDIFVCVTVPCVGAQNIEADITTPNVGEAETRWSMTTGPHQYVFLLNRTAVNMQMYKDGVLQTIQGSGQNSDPGPINYGGLGGGCGGGTCNLRVMASTSGVPSADNFTNGTISDLAFWNVTLTQNEITSLANCVPPNRIEPEHVSYFPIYGVDSPEPNYNALGFANILTLTLVGTSSTLQQVGCQPGGAHH